MRRRLWLEILKLSPYWLLLLMAGLSMAVYVRIEPPVALPEWGSTDPAARQNGETFAVTVPHFYQSLALGLLFLHYICFHLMAVALFGGEFKNEAIDRLRIHPITGSRIWAEKMLAYSLIGLVSLFTCIILYTQMLPWIGRMGALTGSPNTGAADSIAWFIREHVSQWIIMYALIWMLAAASGSCAALWIRQFHAAFAMALILPCIVYLFFTAVGLIPPIKLLSLASLDYVLYLPFKDQGIDVIYTFILSYSLVMLLLGWFIFERLEVRDAAPPCS